MALIVKPAGNRLLIFPSPNDETFTIAYYNNGNAAQAELLQYLIPKAAMYIIVSATLTVLTHCSEFT